MPFVKVQTIWQSLYHKLFIYTFPDGRMKFSRWFLPSLGILLLVYVILKIGANKILLAFASANYSYLLLMFFLFVPMLFVQTAKWRYLLKSQGLKFTFSYLLRLQFISLFYEAVTPGRVGSFIKIVYINKRVKNLGKSTSSVVIDRALDFLFVAFLAFLGSLFLIKDLVNVFYVIIAIFLLFVFGFIILMNKGAMRILVYLFYKVLTPERMKEKARDSFNEFYRNLPSVKAIFIAFFLTAVLWIITYTQAYISAKAFSINVPYTHFMLLFPISVLISLVPITVSGFGTREAVLINLLGKFGRAEQIVASSLAWASASLIVFSILGLYHIFKLDAKLQVRKTEKSRRGRYIKIIEGTLPLIGLTLFVYLLLKIGINNIVRGMIEIRILDLFLALILVFLLLLSQTFKWYVILKKQRIKLSFIEAVKLHFISLFYGFITPSKIGSLIKILYLRKRTGSIGESTSSVFIDRSFDLIVVLMLAAIGSIVIINRRINSIWIFLILIASIIGFLFLISQNRGRKFLNIILQRMLSSHLYSKTRKGFDGFYKSLPKKKFLMLPFTLTILNWLITYLPNYILARSIGIEIDYIHFVLILAIATVIGQIPITISGLGTREASLIGLFSLFGVEAYKVMSLSILSLILIAVLPALIGFAISLRMNRFGIEKIAKRQNG